MQSIGIDLADEFVGQLQLSECLNVPEPNSAYISPARTEPDMPFLRLVSRRTIETDYANIAPTTYAI
jgi:hypothetical protein